MPISNYRADLRANVRKLWNGFSDFDEFFADMQDSIRRGFTQAWNEGAALFGRLPGEMTPGERIMLNQAINREFTFITGFADAIEQNSKANKGKLGPLFTRTEKWVVRWNDFFNQAKLAAAADRKLLWRVFSEEPCISAVKLRNKVKLGSMWDARNIRPQSNRLQCMIDAGGVTVCKCQFEETDLPLSRGPLPSIP